MKSFGTLSRQCPRRSAPISWTVSKRGLENATAIAGTRSSDARHKTGPKPRLGRLAATRRLAELIVWSTGEAELAMGFDSDLRVNEHQELASVEELDDLLSRFSGWLDAGPRDAEALNRACPARVCPIDVGG